MTIIFEFDRDWNKYSKFESSIFTRYIWGFFSISFSKLKLSELAKRGEWKEL